MIVLPSVAAKTFLNLLIDSWDTWVHLYTSSVFLGRDTVLADLVEPDWRGYAPLLIDTWSPAQWVDPNAVTFADQVRWTSPGTTPVTLVYGYYVTNDRDGPLLWAEAAPGGPINAGTPGRQVNLYPQFTLHWC